MTRRRWRRSPQPEREGDSSFASELLRHGHGWIAALASVAGVAVTVVAATSGNDTPTETPRPSASLVAASQVAGPGAETGSATPAPSASREAEPPPRASGNVIAGGPITDTAQLGAVLESFGLPGAAPYIDYQTVADASVGLRAEAPSDWNDQFITSWLGGDLEQPEVLGDVLIATPSERGLYSGYSTPGIFFAVSANFSGLSGEEIMDQAGWSSYQNCNWAGSDDFATERYIGGYYAVFWGCDGEDIVILEVATPARDGSYSAFFHARMTTSADIAAVVRAIDTFDYRPTATQPSAEATP